MLRSVSLKIKRKCYENVVSTANLKLSFVPFLKIKACS